MPSRILRAGITTSRKWNNLDWVAQSFYIRLLTLVDDFGRYEADPQLLRAYAFPLRDDVTCQQIADICQQLAGNGLVELYQDNEGKQFIQVSKWQERVRTKSKFPSKEECICQQSADNCQQLAVNCPPPTPTPSPTPTPTPTPACQQVRALEEKEVEPLIPTWDDVKAEAALRGILEASAKSFFDHHEGNQLWLNKYGKLIHWKHKLQVWATNDRQPKPTNNANRSTNNRQTPNRNAGTHNDKPGRSYASLVR